MCRRRRGGGGGGVRRTFIMIEIGFRLGIDGWGMGGIGLGVWGCLREAQRSFDDADGYPGS